MPNSVQKTTVHKAAHSCRKFNPPCKNWCGYFFISVLKPWVGR